jgi:membrane associated rhomboid family serine protease
VHYGVVHIVMNMVGLIHLGRVAEPAIGSVRFIIAYVVSGVVGFVVTVAWTLLVPSTASWTAGASGAIFGMLGLILGFLWRRGDPRWKGLLAQSAIYIVIFAFIPQINNSAHVGGMLAGVAFGVLFAPGAPQPSRGWQRLLAALLMTAALASLALARTSPLYEPVRDLTLR